ncbi:helix-turn-helix transcriptional regulator [Bacillus cereus]|uniref:helix-turn-helix domain-containing protein n=1 Tax=Bacillus cereus group TaxID=86661 RepID=UPI001443B242|nr:helix-turn-helix transcriptional regulator [Bacillus cereus]NKW77414.1 helix-turn-helix transcriptional regulator [Bacillus cereus]NKX14832.1 helix-turn-helix transcriptional regulator [Bacillus cereus]
MIRNNIGAFCAKNDITIAEACRRTGLARSVLGRIYHNEVANISLDTLDKICRGLDTTADQLIVYVKDEEMSHDDIAHKTQREMSIKSHSNMRKRNKRKKANDDE